MEEVYGKLVTLKLSRLLIIGVHYMADVMFMLVSYAHFQMDAHLARVHGRPHSDSHPIVVVELLLYQVCVLESAKQDICWQLKPLSFSHEFGCNSKEPILVLL
jgi:hypothetical protein